VQFFISMGFDVNVAVSTLNFFSLLDALNPLQNQGSRTYNLKDSRLGIKNDALNTSKTKAAEHILSEGQSTLAEIMHSVLIITPIE
jgi:hypothetical protein